MDKNIDFHKLANNKKDILPAVCMMFLNIEQRLEKQYEQMLLRKDEGDIYLSTANHILYVIQSMQEWKKTLKQNKSTNAKN